MNLLKVGKSVGIFVVTFFTIKGGMNYISNKRYEKEKQAKA